MDTKSASSSAGSNNSRFVTFRLSDERYEQISDVAWRERISLSALVRDALEARVPTKTPQAEGARS